MLEAHRIGLERGVRFSFGDPVAYVAEFASTIPDASPSMRLDQLARRRSEVDVINGQVVELGRAMGVPTPYNESLCAVLHRRESAFPVLDAG
jgi:2-dehydropantoate 2-reductase